MDVWLKNKNYAMTAGEMMIVSKGVARMMLSLLQSLLFNENHTATSQLFPKRGFFSHQVVKVTSTLQQTLHQPPFQNETRFD